MQEKVALPNRLEVEVSKPIVILNMLPVKEDLVYYSCSVVAFASNQEFYLHHVSGL